MFGRLSIGAGSSGTIGAGEQAPVFLEPVNNVTVVIGRDISLTCAVDHLGPNKVHNSFLFPLFFFLIPDL